jgi:uncharacterized protein (DUF1499 family)
MSIRVAGLSAVGVIGAVALVVVVILVVGRERTLATLLGAPQRPRIDFATLTPPARPNWFLLCAPQQCPAAPRDSERVAAGPTFAVSADALDTAVRAAFARQPRTRPQAAYDDLRQYDFVQTSALFGFPDTLTVRVIPHGEDSAGLAIYSRAHYGYSDLGVNQRRVEDWVAAVQRAIDASGQGGGQDKQ